MSSPIEPLFPRYSLKFCALRRFTKILHSPGTHVHGKSSISMIIFFLEGPHTYLKHITYTKIMTQKNSKMQINIDFAKYKYKRPSQVCGERYGGREMPIFKNVFSFRIVKQ